MEIVNAAALTGAVALWGIHATSAAIAARRQRPRTAKAPSAEHPRVAIIRPLKGMDLFTAACLHSTFTLDHGQVEIIFCVASLDDPVVPLVKRLIEDHPLVDARLLIGDERISDNPKLNNLAKGWSTMRSEWVAFIDANVLLPSDAITRLFDAFKPGIGLVSSPPFGTAPDGWEARAECAILNSYQARWQSLADAVGQGFAQGKVLMFHRSLLDGAGGLRALGAEPAEDAAATKVVRTQRLSVALVDRFFPQPVGSRTLGDIWRRQARWASLRRASFPLQYAAEFLSYPWLAVALAALAMHDGRDQALAAVAMLGAWYSAEAICGRLVGWPEGTVHRLIRDVMLPLAWAKGWVSSDFIWHGHSMRAERGSSMEPGSNVTRA